MLTSLGAIVLLIACLAAASFAGQKLERHLAKKSGSIIAPQWAQVLSVGVTVVVAASLIFVFLP